MINPYLMYSLFYLLVLIAYSFGWATIYPKMTVSLGVFIMCTIFISLIVGVLTYKSFRQTRQSSFRYQKSYKLICVLIIVGTLIEGILSGGFPIIGNVDYTEFGIKTLHPLIQYCSAIFAYVSVVTLIDTNKDRCKLLLCLLVAFFPFVVALSRGMIFSTGIVCVLLIVAKKGIKRKNIVPVIIFAMFAAYLFGALGNVRLSYQVGNTESNNYNDSSLIMSIGVANQKFVDSSIPTPFFWTYLYATSPLANLQNTINNKYTQGSTISEFVVTQWMPDYFSKMLFPSHAIRLKTASANTQVTSLLTAGGTYLQPYILWGWTGIIIMFCYLMLFPIIYVYILKKIAPRFFDIGVSLLTVIYLLSVFDNMLAFSGLSFQLIILLMIGAVDTKLKSKTVKVVK